MINYKFDKYIIKSDLPYEIFECNDYFCLTFHKDDLKFDIVNNKHMGMRLIIYSWPSSCKDVPFNPNTFHLLPNEVQVEVLLSS